MRRILIVVTLGLVSVWPTLAYTNIDTNTADGHAKYIGSEVESRFAQAAEATPTENLFWQSIQNSDDPHDFDAYLQQYPNGAFSSLARIRLNKLKQLPTSETPTSTPPTTTADKPSTAEPTRTIQPNGLWRGSVSFVHLVETYGSEDRWSDKYVCDLELELEGYSFEEWFRCAQISFQLVGTVNDDGTLDSAKIWAGGGAVYPLEGTIWESEGVKQGTNWKAIVNLNDE